MSSINDMINKVVNALKNEGINPHISKNGEWGLINFKSGKSDSLCLGSFKKETMNKAKSIVKNNIDRDFICQEDNYFTLFIKKRSTVVIEKVLQSKIDKEYASKKRIPLSNFKRNKLTKDFIDKYKKDHNFLSHARIGKNIDSFCWMDKDKLVAYISVDKTHKKDNYNWCVSFEVMPEYRGYGLSNQILNFAVNTLKMNALSVENDNEIAIKLYIKNGFSKIKEMHSNNMIFMKKKGVK